jgi:hypothetical protein
MFYEFFIKLIGLGILATLFFSPLDLTYQNKVLLVKGQLNEPITYEIQELVKKGYKFKTKLYLSVIVNNQKVLSKIIIKELTNKENYWYLENKKIKFENINKIMGTYKAAFENVDLNDNDEIVVFLLADIIEDKEFTKSTNLETESLWNYHKPTRKDFYIYEKGKLVEKL